MLVTFAAMAAAQEAPTLGSTTLHLGATVVGLEVVAVAEGAGAQALCATPCTIEVAPGPRVLAGRGGGGFVRAQALELPPGELWVFAKAGRQSARRAGFALGAVGLAGAAVLGGLGANELATPHVGEGAPVAYLGGGLVSLLAGGAGLAIAGTQRGRWEVQTERWAE